MENRDKAALLFPGDLTSSLDPKFLRNKPTRIITVKKKKKEEKKRKIIKQLMEAVEEKQQQQIFILSGQRNMSGRGGVRGRTFDNIVPLQSSPLHPSIICFTSASRWEPAAEPLHADVDPSKACGVGPGMAFTNALIEPANREDDVAVGLVPCVVGGTTIDEWASGSGLYERMVERTKEAAGGGGGGGDKEGAVVPRGEQHPVRRSCGGLRGKMGKLIGDVRADLNLPSLPFIQVAIASGEERLIEKIRADRLGINLPNVVCVDAKGSLLNEDNMHLSTQAQVCLGQKLADDYLRYLMKLNHAGWGFGGELWRRTSTMRMTRGRGRG